MSSTQELPEAAHIGKVFRAPLGAASPLWLAYGAVAGAGVAYWWLSRWARFTHLEALAVPAPEAAAEPAPVLAAPAEEPVAVETVPAEPVVSAAEDKPAAAHPAAPAADGDDLTRLVGVGPKLAQALVEHGVNSFAQIAAWTDEELAEIDLALDLKGRAARDAWVAQAKQLAGDAPLA